MPTYKYSNTAGKTMWYCSFYYTDWTGARKRKVKRGFTTRRVYAHLYPDRDIELAQKLDDMIRK